MPRVAAPARRAPLFSRKATAILLSVVVAIAAFGAGSVAVAMVWVRTPAITMQGRRVEQPVPFSHQIHAAGLQIDCRYCHATVERTPSAGMPSTRTCIGCHNAAWLSSAAFEPVRRSLRTGEPIPWNRVNHLPDFVYFNHAIHVNRNVPCASCHGDVATMPRVEQAAPLTMQWCLDCHRDPAPFVRPVPGSTVRRAAGRPWPVPRGTPDSLALPVARLLDCSSCHR